jgi:hypothetical protein
LHLHSPGTRLYQGDVWGLHLDNPHHYGGHAEQRVALTIKKAKNILTHLDTYDKGGDKLTSVRCKKCHRLLVKVSDKPEVMELVCPKCGLRQSVKK